MGKLEDCIDYLELALDRRKMAKLSLLLKHSIADQVILDNLRRLRRLVQSSDPAQPIYRLSNDPVYNEKLHASIMQKVAQCGPDSNEQLNHPSVVAQGSCSSQETYSRR